MVWEGDLYAGSLPPICVLTGEPAEQRLSVRYTTTPSWVVLLLFLGVVPAIVGWLLTRRTARGSLPLSARGAAVLSRRHRLALGAILVGVPLAIGGGTFAGALDPNVGGLVLCVLLVVALLLVLAATRAYTPNAVRAHVEEPTPWGRWVQLHDVSDAFALAVQRMYADRAVHMYGMPAPPVAMPPGTPSPWAIGAAPVR